MQEGSNTNLSDITDLFIVILLECLLKAQLLIISYNVDYLTVLARGAL